METVHVPLEFGFCLTRDRTSHFVIISQTRSKPLSYRINDGKLSILQLIDFEMLSYNYTMRFIGCDSIQTR